MKKEKKELNVHIGEHIRTAREATGYTQERFSEAIDVSVQYVSDLERGTVGTSIQTLVNICNTLHVSSDYILFGEKDDFNTSLLLEKISRLSPSQYAIVEKGLHILIEAVTSEHQK